MIKNTFSVLFLLLFSVITMGQFKPNSIGVCYLENDSGGSYSLKIVFPSRQLEKEIGGNEDSENIIDTISNSSEIILFDNEGELFRTRSNEQFLVQRWCHNDGGVQFRPTLRTRINKVNLKRPLKAINEIQNICCFAVVNHNQNTFSQVKLLETGESKSSGDINYDGKPECFIWTEPDDAQNCDGNPENSLRVILRVGNEDYDLRCCGP